MSNPDTKKFLNTSELKEQDVKHRMEARGYHEVAELRKDDRGIWQGKTTLKDGRPAKVIFDLDGNIYSKPINGSQ